MLRRSAWFETNYIPEHEILGSIVALIPEMALVALAGARWAGGQDVSHAGTWADTAHSHAAGSAAQHISTSPLPCLCVCWVRFGKGQGSLPFVALFVDAQIPQLAGWSRGGRGRTAAEGCPESSQLREEVIPFQAGASSFGHASKVLAQQRVVALAYSCFINLESLCLDFPDTTWAAQQPAL